MKPLDDPYTFHALEIVGNAIVGGVEQYVYHIAQRLPAYGFKISCVTPYRSSFTVSMEETDSPVYVTHMDNDPPWRSIQFLTELVRHQKVDLLHAHLPKAQVLAGIVGRLTNTPVVTTIHGMDISSWELGILRTTGSHLNLVCHNAYAQALALGLDPNQVTLIPNGVDLDRFRPHASGSAFRKTTGVPPGAILVGFVGRLNWEKGPDFFIQTAHYIHQHQPDVYFAILGDGPMKAELWDTVREMGLQDRVMMPGTWTDMANAYGAFDLLVQTSRVEGMPLTLLEGMACGLPVVAMNAGGVGEIIEVGLSGYMAAVGDWAGVGAAALRLIENEGLRKTIGLGARQRVEDQFDLKTCIGRLAEEFRTMLGKEVKVPPNRKRDLGSSTASFALAKTPAKGETSPGDSKRDKPDTHS